VSLTVVRPEASGARLECCWEPAGQWSSQKQVVQDWNVVGSLLGSGVARSKWCKIGDVGVSLLDSGAG
jgi:hypothetical protein